jgi:hypothetical protein
LVERVPWAHEVAGSNPVSQTIFVTWWKFRYTHRSEKPGPKGCEGSSPSVTTNLRGWSKRRLAWLITMKSPAAGAGLATSLCRTLKRWCTHVSELSRRNDRALWPSPCPAGGQHAVSGHPTHFCHIGWEAPLGLINPVAEVRVLFVAPFGAHGREGPDAALLTRSFRKG